MDSVFILTEDRQQGNVERRRRHVCCERKQVAGQGRGDVHGACGEVRQVSSDTAPEAGRRSYRRRAEAGGPSARGGPATGHSPLRGKAPVGSLSSADLGDAMLRSGVAK